MEVPPPPLAMHYFVNMLLFQGKEKLQIVATLRYQAGAKNTNCGKQSMSRREIQIAGRRKYLLMSELEIQIVGRVGGSLGSEIRRRLGVALLQLCSPVKARSAAFLHSSVLTIFELLELRIGCLYQKPYSVYSEKNVCVCVDIRGLLIRILKPSCA